MQVTDEDRDELQIKRLYRKATFADDVIKI